ncbi:molybdenum cofactor guanylyltransferase [Alkalicoccus daliensis]|uniref:Probable molybdenum cofactor guanylyltransferase n=1 Tax=Alkalicoccus daliensis TaxID=745820 RepID=A0A1H0H056_9BACI|nr:molybdenum cofactor guanylyltransferase [Alkalicoccus daliensis]SDO12557.1 molybdopterin-guanine dinucleotide biosynthesis protein A [Alkalicoccus daliensis]
MGSASPEITGVILAGGKSSRMGENKALLPLGNKSAVEHVVDKIRPQAEELLLISNEPEVFSYLEINTAADLRPFEGPLAGIEAAMTAVDSEWYLIAACDMPLIQKSVIEYLCNVSNKTQSNAVIPEIQGKQHPLLALYHRDCLPAISAVLDAQKRAIKSMLDSVTFDTVTEHDMIEAGISESEIVSSFYNMNRPAEYQEIMKRFS